MHGRVGGVTTQTHTEVHCSYLVCLQRFRHLGNLLRVVLLVELSQQGVIFVFISISFRNKGWRIRVCNGMLRALRIWIARVPFGRKLFKNGFFSSLLVEDDTSC